ncbi:hypothetical protein AD18_0244 [Escherichia coli 3-475-03_S4_C2]|nr:hypothetical protein AD18_0244 [Escherichia coli 3-475-03_S4_C2]
MRGATKKKRKSGIGFSRAGVYFYFQRLFFIDSAVVKLRKF